MSKAQLVITAVVLEGRSKSEVARDYDVSRQWVQQLVRRYQTEGALHSSRAHGAPTLMPAPWAPSWKTVLFGSVKR
jgi:transposase